MQDFSDFVDLTSSMIRDFGTIGILSTQPYSSTYNTATGMSDAVSYDIEIQCILLDKTLTYNGAGVMNNRSMQEGDKLLYVSPTALLLPALMPNGVLKLAASTDKITVGGYKFGIVKVKVIDLSGDGSRPILFELYLRR